jgi:hypothetical protein
MSNALHGRRAAWFSWLHRQVLRAALRCGVAREDIMRDVLDASFTVHPKPRSVDAGRATGKAVNVAQHYVARLQQEAQHGP